MIILLGFCSVTALLKAVARCFLPVSLSVPFLPEPFWFCAAPRGVTFNGEHTRERVSTNTEQFLPSSPACVDLADKGDTVCEEVYTFGLTENEKGFYFLLAFTYISGCACTASGHLVFSLLSFSVQRKQGFVVSFSIKNRKTETVIFHVSAFMEVIFSRWEKKIYHFSLEETVFQIRVYS